MSRRRRLRSPRRRDIAVRYGDSSRGSKSHRALPQRGRARRGASGPALSPQATSDNTIGQLSATLGSGFITEPLPQRRAPRMAKNRARRQRVVDVERARAVRRQPPAVWARSVRGSIGEPWLKTLPVCAAPAAPDGAALLVVPIENLTRAFATRAGVAPELRQPTPELVGERAQVGTPLEPRLRAVTGASLPVPARGVMVAVGVGGDVVSVAGRVASSRTVVSRNDRRRSRLAESLRSCSVWRRPARRPPCASRARRDGRSARSGVAGRRCRRRYSQRRGG